MARQPLFSGTSFPASVIIAALGRTTTQALTAAAGWNLVHFTSESEDSDNMIDIGTNDDRIVVKTKGTGLWLLEGTIQINHSNVGNRHVVVTTNGGVPSSGSHIASSSISCSEGAGADDPCINFHKYLYNLAVNDYFQIYVHPSINIDLNTARVRLFMLPYAYGVAI